MLKGDAPWAMHDGAARRCAAVKMPTPVEASANAKFGRLGDIR
jgi:hypothetical protein